MNWQKVLTTFVVASLLFSAILSLRLHAQQQQPAPNGVGVPKPATDPTAGTWKYKVTAVQGDGTHVMAHSVAVKDDGSVWTVTGYWPAGSGHPGPVTDVQTLEKSTLILRKESLDHFAKPGQPWKPMAINLDFTGNKVTGTAKYASGQDAPVAIDLDGPVFAGAALSDVKVGCLPLADGYSTTLRTFDIGRLAVNPQASEKEKLLQLKVVGQERVTVPAGTFDSYKVEFASADGGSVKRTAWIAKESRILVKSSGSETVGRGNIITTVELVP